MRTNILLAGFTFTALVSATTAFGADPRLLNLVMPDATTLAGANVTNAEITPFGQFVLTQLSSSVNQELQNFVTTTGFDPRRDISEILAASSSSVTNHSGLVLAIGNFNVPQITAAIAAKAPTQAVQTYDGATLITSANPGTNVKSSFSLAFLGTNIAIVGDTVSVKAAIDRSQSANSISTALAVQVQALSTSEDAWVVTTTPLTSLIPGLGASPATGTAPAAASPFGVMFSSIQGSSGGVKFGTNVQITGQVLTTDAASATSLANVLQALVSIASMAGGQDPQIAILGQILQGMKVTTDGTAINVALSIPETQVEGILNSMKNQAKPALRPAIRPAIAPRAHRDPASAQQ